MERRPDNIHELLGKLRRRVTELLNGDYSRGYKDEMAFVKIFIESYFPTDIVNCLNPLYEDLLRIDESIYSQVTDNLYDLESDDVPERNYTGESPRDLMREEVAKYTTQLEFYLKKYSAYILNTAEEEKTERKLNPDVIHYYKYNKFGQENLTNLHNALRNHIEPIPLSDFKKIFSGENQFIENPIFWKKHKNELRYFLRLLYSHDAIEGNRINWNAVTNCFRYNGEVIYAQTFKSNNSKPLRFELFDKIISNL